MINGPMVTEANRIAVERIAACVPVLAGLDRASDVLGLGPMELGHAGPPFRSTAEIPPLVLGALAGAAVHEGWADSQDAGRAMVRSGTIRLHANHDLGTVSPMAVHLDQPDAPLPNGIDAQTELCFLNFERILARTGYNFADTVFARIFLRDFERDYSGLNRVFHRHWHFNAIGIDPECSGYGTRVGRRAGWKGSCSVSRSAVVLVRSRQRQASERRIFFFPLRGRACRRPRGQSVFHPALAQRTALGQ